MIHKIYGAVGGPFRRKRMASFLEEFGVTAQTTIIDVGGVKSVWRAIAAKVTVVNIDERNADIVADARCLPFPDQAFDIAYSNSLIEHVIDGRDLIASEIQRIAQRYYIQTPNRDFPIEPHVLAPFIHWFSPEWQRKLIRATPWAVITSATEQQCRQFLETTKLLDERELRDIFPDAEIRRERFAGMTKSLIAMRHGSGTRRAG